MEKYKKEEGKQFEYNEFPIFQRRNIQELKKLV